MADVSPSIDRLGSRDLTTLASDHGPVPMNIGAVLLFDRAGDVDVSAIRTLLADRVAGIPRLRQRLLRPPFGCGRPAWVDDADFDVGAHLRPVLLPVPVTDGAVLREAAALVTQRLAEDRPLWAARWVAGVSGDRGALILVMHHVLADGIGGLAVLAALTDGIPLPAAAGFPQPPPHLLDLAVDAARSRAVGLTQAPAKLANAVAGMRELGLNAARPKRVARTSLNRPTGPTRRVTVVDVALPTVVSAAHATGHTVNDVMLAAVSGAFFGLLERRGEHPAEMVVSVPISTRREASAGALGNDVGVVPVLIPNEADPRRRLPAIAAATARARAGSRGSSAELLSGLFRLLGRLGIVQYFVDHQRLVHTFETYLRGPAAPLTMGGLHLGRIIPMAVNPGNVGVSFDVLSYAGRLVISVVADPEVVPDQAVLTRLLEQELAELAAAAVGSRPD